MHFDDLENQVYSFLVFLTYDNYELLKNIISIKWEGSKHSWRRKRFKKPGQMASISGAKIKETIQKTNIKKDAQKEENWIFLLLFELSTSHCKKLEKFLYVLAPISTVQ